ncbi:MAG: hypothetical protein HN366_19915 [Deltaproteobacteria bacterium]|jgi:hypothetical protein|nr:hypothetical protein [Deltaproteobacteria bacterium]
MTFEEHCRESIVFFGKPYEELHRWLDEFQKAPGRHIGQQNSMVEHTQLKDMAAAQRGLALHILN